MAERRIKAFLIDFLIHFLFFLPVIVYAFYNFLQNLHHYPWQKVSFELKIVVIYSAATVLVLSYRNYKLGTSMGKKWAGVKVIDINSKKSPGLLKRIIRSYVNFLFFPVNAVFLWSDRSFGDMVVNCTLVYSEEMPEANVN
ncbi:MAG: RDD family protein [Bacteroidia bacterium]|nr:RDD family protein [Bacteroidia bacterium]